VSDLLELSMSARHLSSRFGRLPAFSAISALVVWGAAAPVQAHDGPHDTGALALIQHVVAHPDHWLASGIMLAVAAVLGVTSVRLWARASRAQAAGARRAMATACLAASGVLIWTVARTATASML
jgi:hypothetical protein